MRYRPSRPRNCGSNAAPNILPWGPDPVSTDCAETTLCADGTDNMLSWFPTERRKAKMRISRKFITFGAVRHRGNRLEHHRSRVGAEKARSVGTETPLPHQERSEGAKYHTEILKEFGGAMQSPQTGYVVRVGKNIAQQSRLGNRERLQRHLAELASQQRLRDTRRLCLHHPATRSLMQQ